MHFIKLFLYFCLYLLFFSGCVTIQPAQEIGAKPTLKDLWETVDIATSEENYKKEREELYEIISRIPDHHYALFRLGKSLWNQAEHERENASFWSSWKYIGSYCNTNDCYAHTRTLLWKFIDSVPIDYPSEIQEEALWIIARTYEREAAESSAFFPVKMICAIGTAQHRLLAESPDTKYATEAELLIQKARKAIAHHIFFIGEFYNRTHAYTSARLRFQQVLDYYRGFDLDEKAERYISEINERYSRPQTQGEQLEERLLFSSKNLDPAREAEQWRLADGKEPIRHGSQDDSWRDYDECAQWSENSHVQRILNNKY